jgi:large subunit ribosomal protein L20
MRIKRGKTGHRRHKKYLAMAKGYRGSRSTLYRTARETVERALCFAYRDRKQKKRAFRRLWIMRINAAVRQEGLSYNKFMHGLKLAEINLNRKVLADMAVYEKDAFAKLCEIVKAKA